MKMRIFVMLVLGNHSSDSHVIFLIVKRRYIHYFNPYNRYIKNRAYMHFFKHVENQYNFCLFVYGCYWLHYLLYYYFIIAEI